MGRFWALVGLSLVMAGCGDEPPAEAPLPQPVKLYTVNGDSAGQLRHYPGRVVATEGSQLAFRVSGQLVKLPVRAGEQVKKGQCWGPWFRRLSIASWPRVRPRTFLQKGSVGGLSGCAGAG